MPGVLPGLPASPQSVPREAVALLDPTSSRPEQWAAVCTSPHAVPSAHPLILRSKSSTCHRTSWTEARTPRPGWGDTPSGPRPSCAFCLPVLGTASGHSRQRWADARGPSADETGRVRVTAEPPKLSRVLHSVISCSNSALRCPSPSWLLRAIYMCVPAPRPEDSFLQVLSLQSKILQTLDFGHRYLFLTVLEGTSPRSRYPADSVSGGSNLLACRWLPSHCVLTWPFLSV